MVDIHHQHLAAQFFSSERRTSAPIGAWKCNFSPLFRSITSDRRTIQPTKVTYRSYQRETEFGHSLTKNFWDQNLINPSDGGCLSEHNRVVVRILPLGWKIQIRPVDISADLIKILANERRRSIKRDQSQ